MKLQKERRYMKDFIELKTENILSVRLLETSEWSKLTFNTPNIPIESKSNWWLDADKLNNCVGIVVQDGRVHFWGSAPNVTLGVRPAFTLNQFIGQKGEKLLINKTPCTFIQPNEALSDIVICQHIFDPHTNLFENSELKKFINSDEFKKLL